MTHDSAVHLEQELCDICADLQEGGSWAQHRDRFSYLNSALAAAARQGGDAKQAPAESPQSDPKGNAQKVQP
jgi:hypothetical protein